MKRTIRILALVLTLVMVLGTTALAAGTQNQTGEYTITGDNGCTATFTTVEVDGKNEDVIQVTYTDESLVDGNYYLVLMLRGDNTIANVTGPNILYIDQKSGVEADNKTLTFTVFPEDLAAGTIVITGTTITAKEGEVGLVAAIINAEVILGDVDNNGTINGDDLICLAKYMVGNYNIPKLNNADVDEKVGVNGDDLIRLAKFLVGAASLGK